MISFLSFMGVTIYNIEIYTEDAHLHTRDSFRSLSPSISLENFACCFVYLFVFCWFVGFSKNSLNCWGQ